VQCGPDSTRDRSPTLIPDSGFGAASSIAPSCPTGKTLPQPETFAVVTPAIVTDVAGIGPSTRRSRDS
jgi:hypothetical protein